MKILGLQVGTIDRATVDRSRRAEVTYDHVGSTLDPDDDPTGTRYERQINLADGEAAFTAARTALRSWSPQRSLGVLARPVGVAPDLGETVVLGLGVGWLRLAVPNRIVAVVDEADRYAYAYGTLPGHPEQGEELFHLKMESDGSVTFTIRVDARPAAGLRRLDFAIRPLQRLALRRYLSTIARCVTVAAQGRRTGA